MRTTTIETDFLPAEPLLPRPIFRFELLERRILLTIVPIDATAGLPFEGLVATEFHLPAYATGPELMNVILSGQYDYAPTAVKQPDGTYNLYTKMTMQRAGTEEMSIWFRNDLTGGWDVLESGEQTVKANHFSNTIPDNYLSNEKVRGTQVHDVLAIFTTSLLTQSLENYDVEIGWFGKTKTGRLVEQPDGTVAAYVNDGYLPVGGGDANVTVTIRLANAPAHAPPVGFASVYVSAGAEVPFGMFAGSRTETEFNIMLPNRPPHLGSYGHFIPATELEGWTSTFTVDVLWQEHETGENLGWTTGTVVRNPDGSYSVVGTLPPQFPTSDNGMIKIHETVQRPAVDGEPAQEYEVGYVGSFDFVPVIYNFDPVEPPPVTPPTQENPEDPPTIVPPSIDDLVDSTAELPDSTPITWMDGETAADSLADSLFDSPDDALLGDGNDADVMALVD